MAKETLKRALELISALEGGFVNIKADPGGATMRGITLRTYSAYLGRQATESELRAIPDDTWAAIMTSQYADPICYADLPAGLDVAAFDVAVNSGPARAGRLLQQALGFAGPAVDGVIGHHTLDALAHADPETVIRDLCAARLAYMKTLKTWGTFGRGWEARVEHVETAALLLANGRAAIPVGDLVPEAASAKAFGPTKMLSVPSGQAVLATAGTAATTVAAGAAQVTTILQPHADHKLVQYILFGAALATAASAVVTVLVTKNRTDGGATT